MTLRRTRPAWDVACRLDRYQVGDEIDSSEVLYLDMPGYRSDTPNIARFLDFDDATCSHCRTAPIGGFYDDRDDTPRMGWTTCHVGPEGPVCDLCIVLIERWPDTFMINYPCDEGFEF